MRVSRVVFKLLLCALLLNIFFPSVAFAATTTTDPGMPTNLSLIPFEETLSESEIISTMLEDDFSYPEIQAFIELGSTPKTEPLKNKTNLSNTTTTQSTSASTYDRYITWKGRIKTVDYYYKIQPVLYVKIRYVNNIPNLIIGAKSAQVDTSLGKLCFFDGTMSYEIYNTGKDLFVDYYGYLKIGGDYRYTAGAEIGIGGIAKAFFQVSGSSTTLAYVRDAENLYVGPVRN